MGRWLRRVEHRGGQGSGWTDGEAAGDEVTDVAADEACRRRVRCRHVGRSVDRDAVLDGDPLRALQVEVSVGGLHPGTVVSLVAEGDSQVRWRCGSTAGAGDAATTVPAAASTRAWAEVSVGADSTGSTVVRLLPSPAAADLCPPGSTDEIPVATDVRWEDVRVRDPLDRLVLMPEPVLGEQSK